NLLTPHLGQGRFPFVLWLLFCTLAGRVLGGCALLFQSPRLLLLQVSLVPEFAVLLALTNRALQQRRTSALLPRCHEKCRLARSTLPLGCCSICSSDW